MPNLIPTKVNQDKAFISLKDDNAFSVYQKALASSEAIIYGKGAISNRFRNLDTNTSVREGFSRTDYEYFRPGEATPKTQKAIMAACIEAYYKVGIVQNIIDLMSEFASKGLRIVHPNKSVENFYRNWFEQIHGEERSERFINNLFKCGNVVVKRTTAKLKKNRIEDFRRTIASDIELDPEYKLDNKNIPWTYVFINPMNVDVLNEDLALFTGKTQYAVNVSKDVANLINAPTNTDELGIVNSLPSNVLKSLRGGSTRIILDSDELRVYHRKKDDWQTWAYPMTYAILDDLITLEKLKLADIAALDGAISHIRLWKLGSLEHQILPTDAAIAKLADILLNNIGSGSMDLIWGPDIELKETSTDIYRFLGSEKYAPTLSAIYAGLGIPASLTGGTGSQGFTNNFMSLKTMIERLNYVRSILLDFWTYELRLVQKAFGFTQPAKIIFDNMDLSDEASEKSIWLQLFDRDIISLETLREKLGQANEVEDYRIEREYKKRDKKKIPPKAGAFVDGQPELTLKKIALQNGSATPSQVGLDLEKPKPGEIAMIQKMGGKTLEPNISGQPGQGRPLNSNDKKKRKQKKVGVTTKGSSSEFVRMSLWAYNTQDRIGELCSPFILSHFNKKSLRNLNDAETSTATRLKYMILYAMEPYSEINIDKINEIINQGLFVYSKIDTMNQKIVSRFVEKNNREPNFEELKQIYSYTYTIFKGNFNGEN